MKDKGGGLKEGGEGSKRFTTKRVIIDNKKPQQHLTRPSPNVCRELCARKAAKANACSLALALS